jgi:hypothetical protein
VLVLLLMLIDYFNARARTLSIALKLKLWKNIRRYSQDCVMALEKEFADLEDLIIFCDFIL